MNILSILKFVFVGACVSTTILTSCSDNNDGPKDPAVEPIQFNAPYDNYTPDSDSRNPYRDFAKALTALRLDLSICQEIHDAVSSSARYGLDEVYFFKEALDGEHKVFDNISQYGQLLRMKLETYPDNDAVKYIKNFWEEYADTDRFQIYWPYSENWDGKTIPLIAAKNTIYKISDSGITFVDNKLTDEYARQNPVIVINDSPLKYSELPDLSVSNTTLTDNILTIYNPISKEATNSPQYLTNADIDNYLNKRSSHTYSLYIKSISAEAPAIYEGGAYRMYTILNIDGCQINNQEELEACQGFYWSYIVCLTRENCRHGEEKKFVDVDLLLSGDAHPRIGELPLSCINYNGKEILWDYESKQRVIMFASDNNTLITKLYKMPYLEIPSPDLNKFINLSRPGFWNSEYAERENLFGDTGLWSNHGEIIFGITEGATIPQWAE